MIIDNLVSQITQGKHTFDKDGKIASQGNVNKKLLDELLKNPFFRRKHPKTTGREEFGNRYSVMFLQKSLEINLMYLSIKLVQK